ncbi:diacylglycerol/lipid kinase family protein [Geomesophilobacter sediminis]|uniref:Diacylglycerol kinase family lipid kinase n=1 Tax=Geomesophilobacter sediminis TaxID=2798584 RepID=A0A8J7M0W0_9BACT|nr:diacylglycerol kinase family protein [Geomesophilobacter sediminis]MBJ6726511.1 diacylglycerol kinase family lipid kinase [Geomesophilobacter sediminis]
MSRRCFLIVNPTSGGYRTEKIQRVLEKLQTGGYAPELLPTGSAEDAPLFARRICAEESTPLILVAGGDGTINGVLNGLEPGRATLAVLPLGTSNVLSRELKIHSLDDAVARVLKGESRAVSVGELESCRETRRFLLMAGIGVDGAVVEGVRLSEKRRWGKGAYVLSALRHLVDWDAQDLTVKAAGKNVACHGVIVCNAAKYGGNFLLAPKADIFSPGFQVLCITGGRITYLKLAALLASGRVAESPDVKVIEATELEVAGEKAVQLDGDPCGRLPVKVRSLADFCRVIV